MLLRRIVLVVVLMVAMVVAVQRRARRRAAAIARRSPLGRHAMLARLGTRSGADLTVTRARQVFASAERRLELDEAFQLRTAEAVRETLGDMKGALMKLGQLASFVDQGLPEPVRAALAQLRTSAPPMSAELAAGVVARELGGRPEDVFDTWDPEPLAAASIGQVHRAITRDGRAVAVKVQYPGVDEAIGTDLRAAQALFTGLASAFPGLEPGPIVAELRARVLEELDYEKEAENQELFVEAYRGHPTIHVPAVVPALSTARVLTTELAEGVPFEAVTRWSQEERNLAAETIYRFAFGSLYRLRAFNGDPHPGNYLFRPGGNVTFVDFGLVRRFSSAEIDTFASMIKAMVFDRDIARFREILKETGLLRTADRFPDDQIQEYFSHFYAFVMDHDDAYPITPEFAAQTVRHMFRAGEDHRDITKAANVPPSFVILQRINLGLYAIFGELGAVGPWRRISEELWPFVDGPPATPMGEAIAAWEAARVSRIGAGP